MDWTVFDVHLLQTGIRISQLKAHETTTNHRFAWVHSLVRWLSFYGVIIDEMVAITATLRSIVLLAAHFLFAAIDTNNRAYYSFSFVSCTNLLHRIPYPSTATHDFFYVCVVCSVFAKYVCFYLFWPNYSLSCDSISRTIMVCGLYSVSFAV